MEQWILQKFSQGHQYQGGLLCYGVGNGRKGTAEWSESWGRGGLTGPAFASGDKEDKTLGRLAAHLGLFTGNTQC